MSDQMLRGRRVAVLRAGGERDGVRDALLDLGAKASTIVVATILDRPDDEVRRAVGDLARFEWVAVTSSNAARRLELWADEWPPACRVAAVGPATAAAVEDVGLGAPAVSEEGTAGSLAKAIDIGPVLLLAASSARDDLARALASRDVELVTVVAYDVEPRALDADEVASLVASDAIVAMSPVAIDVLCGLGAEARTAAERIPLIAIGPTTERHASGRHWAVARTARSREPSSVADAVGLALSHRVGPPSGRDHPR
jgi:uroporphyrinogen-III synthase